MYSIFLQSMIYVTYVIELIPEAERLYRTVYAADRSGIGILLYCMYRRVAVLALHTQQHGTR